MRFAGVSHPGLIGTAPSAELLATWNKREGELISAHQNAIPAVAFPPEPKGAYVGQDLPKDVLKKIYKEGARTIPGREHGGNCDVGRVFMYACGYLIVLCAGTDQEPLEGLALLLPCLREGRQPVGRRLALLSGGCEHTARLVCCIFH